MNKRQSLVHKVFLCSFFLLATTKVHAQITPDNTLDVISQPVPNVLINGTSADLINGGTQRGNNLFHSFSEFNIEDGQQVYFGNPSGVVNILTRVTGTNASNILGTLGVDGTANLFLINPNGILFGKNASLDIKGSFIGTTAEGIQFGNQGNFSAINPSNPALLTINPSALLFNQIKNTASIQNISIAPSGLNPSQEFIAIGLRVGDGSSLLLVGGDVNLDGGSLYAFGGRVELGGLKQPGDVGINIRENNFSLSFPENVMHGDVSLTNNATVNVAAGGGGSIKVNSNNLNISGVSTLVAGVVSGGLDSKAGNIEINAKETVTIDGTSSTTASSSISNGLLQGMGTPGDVIINTGLLNIIGNAQIGSFTNGQGSAGNVIIRAKDKVTLSGFSSGILSAVAPFGLGNGANINIQAHKVSLTDNAQIATSTTGKGNAGNILISTDDLISVNSGSLVRADSFGQGNAGNISLQAGNTVSFDGNLNASNINISSGAFSVVGQLLVPAPEFTTERFGGNINVVAPKIFLENGAQLNASTFGLGNAGNLFVQANELLSLSNNSVISSNVEPGAVGNGGNINIEAGSLSLINSSQIQTFIRKASETGLAGRGQKAGNTNINVRGDFNLFGVNSNNSNIPSAVLSFVDSQAEGGGGSIDIKTGSISLNDGAVIQSSTYGKGNAGNIQIKTHDLSTGHLSLFNDALVAAESFSPDGIGGNINIEVGQIRASYGGQISSGSGRQFQEGNYGRGGDLSVTAYDSIELDGKGGNVNRTGFFSETSSPNRAGDLTVNTKRLIVKNGAAISSGASGSGSLGGDGGNLTIKVTDSIDLIGNRSGFATEANGLGNAGKLTINTSNFKLRDGSVISAFVVSGQNTTNKFTIGNGGEIEINVDNLEVTNGAQINAATYGQGNAGNIIINASNRISFDGSNGIFGSAAFGEVGNTGIGKGGDIRITTKILDITNAAALVTSSSGQGSAGNIQINASDTNISGNNLETGYSSGLFSFTLPSSTGNGGNITVDTNTLRATNGGLIDARTRNNRKGGDITIKANSVELRSGGQILTTTSGTGSAGQITVNALNKVIIDGIDTTFNNRLSKIGNQPFINVDDKSGFFVRSTSIGSAGDININSPRVRLNNQGKLIADSTSGNGGNINLNSNLLLLRKGAQISTNAGTEQLGGDGGNININSRFIVAVPNENSDITANAFTGRGGNVFIRSQGVFGIEPRAIESSLTSDITASSAQGVQGQISITEPDVEPAQGLIELPEEVVDATRRIAQICPRQPGAKPLGEFTITGRGSLPPSPLEPLSGATNSTKLATLEPNNTKVSNIVPNKLQNAIVEAQHWIQNKDGSVELVEEESRIYATPNNLLKICKVRNIDPL